MPQMNNARFAYISSTDCHEHVYFIFLAQIATSMSILHFQHRLSQACLFCISSTDCHKHVYFVFLLNIFSLFLAQITTIKCVDSSLVNCKALTACSSPLRSFCPLTCGICGQYNCIYKYFLLCWSTLDFGGVRSANFVYNTVFPFVL